MNEHQPVTSLLVVDVPGHALLIHKNLRRAGMSIQISTLDNGEKAGGSSRERPPFQYGPSRDNFQ